MKESIPYKTPTPAAKALECNKCYKNLSAHAAINLVARNCVLLNNYESNLSQ